MTPFPGKITKQIGKLGQPTITLSADQEEWLRQWYPLTEGSRISEAMGVSLSTVHRLARARSLTKSKKGMAAIHRRRTKRATKTCEKNGYYERMRGVGPSQACKDAFQRRVAKVRAGELPHNYEIMRKKHPKKYEEMKKKTSERFKEMWRKERRRQDLTLPRHTHLRIPLNPYTTSQLCQRSNCLKSGYILHVDCSDEGGHRYKIYYDEDTKRGEVFERNATANGFTIEPWPYKD